MYHFWYSLNMTKARKANPRRGSSFDDFLKQEGLHDEVVAHAEKEILVWKLQTAMKEKKVTVSALARRTQTSRDPSHSRSRQSLHYARQPRKSRAGTRQALAVRFGRRVEIHVWQATAQKAPSFGARLLRADPFVDSLVEHVQWQCAAPDHFIMERTHIEFIA
jgi:hypothetical protein